MQSTCEQCKYNFEHSPQTQGRFCSQACYRDWQIANGRQIKVCPTCEQEFSTYKDPANARTYCSPKCRPSKVEKVKKVCEGCQCDFEVYPSQDMRKYCSAECKAKHVNAATVCPGCNIKFTYNKNSGRRIYCSRKCEKIHSYTTSKCPECHTVFKHLKSSPRIYCSRKCSNAVNAKSNLGIIELPPMFCEWCNAEIANNKRSDKRFCSQKCFGKWQSVSVFGENHPAYSQCERTCQNCNKTFTAVPSQIANGEALFCSNECKHEFGRAYCTCWQCEKSFHTAINQVMNGGGKFCSKKCVHAWLKDHPPTHQLPVMCGADHPNYRGGYKGNYYGPNWRKQQRKVRKRAGYRCECCGKTQKQNKIALDVHHVKAFRSFGYIPDVNDHFLAANRLDNLIAVCRSCHMKIEMGSLTFQPYLL